MIRHKFPMRTINLSILDFKSLQTLIDIQQYFSINLSILDFKLQKNFLVG